MTIAYSTHIIEQMKNEDDVYFTKNLAIESNYPIIEMNISCKSLVKHQLAVNFNPVCVLYTLKDGEYVETDRTEVISCNPNPHFFKNFKALYIFGSKQPLKFLIIDSNAKTPNISQDDIIGSCKTTVHHLVSNLDQEQTFDLKYNKVKGPWGQLTIKCHQSKSSNEQVEGQLEAKNLKKTKTFGKNNPFFEIHKQSETGDLIPVYRSEIKAKCNSCRFRQFSIIKENFYNRHSNNSDNRLIIKFYNYRKCNPPLLIGFWSGTVSYFLKSAGEPQIIKDEATSEKVGEFLLTKIEIHKTPTFIDYLRSGIKLSVVTSIDFSESNGEPSDPTSLHHISKKDGSSMNEYEKCILSVGSILAKYDSSQEFEVYGFGLSISDSSVHHFYPLTAKRPSNKVSGVQGILNVYRETLNSATLSKPSNFETTIANVAAKATNDFFERRAYTILLILTDGKISDMERTKEAIIGAADAPISIIIAGVGGHGFAEMEELDSDECPFTTANGEKVGRSIVQFLPFRKLAKMTQTEIERKVLAEIPGQIQQYCITHGYEIKLQ